MEQDHELILSFRSGNEEAFDMLVKKYHSRAINIAYSLLSNLTDAEDAAQEAFFNIYRKLKDFRMDSSFSTWLYRIVVNSSYDLMRKRKVRHISLDDIGLKLIPITEDKSDCLKKETVQAALEGLPFEYRSAIVLREMEGLSYEEIAKILNINIGTVESRIFRARQMLKEIFLKKGVF
jgi:RNA polymerase sigma-70 factor (ECF subfamily)